MKQQSGNDNYVFATNELIACIRENDFLVSTFKEHGAIIYPPSRPDTDSEKQKQYARIIYDLRKMVDINGQPDFEKRQAHLIKILWNSVQALIIELKKKRAAEVKEEHKKKKKQDSAMHQKKQAQQKKLDDLIQELVKFGQCLISSTDDGKQLKWELKHAESAYLAIYKKELEMIKLRLSQAAKDLETLKSSDEYLAIKKSLSNINASAADHRLDPRAKLAKIYVHAKAAEQKIKERCTKRLDSEIDAANATYTNSYLSAKKTLSEISFPIKGKELSAESPKKVTVETSSRLAITTEEVHQQTQASSDSSDIEESDETLNPVAPGEVSLATAAATTSKQLDKYENKDKGFFRMLFNRGSSRERLQLAHSFRSQTLALVIDAADPQKIPQNIDAFVRSIKETQKQLETDNLNRHPVAWFLSRILPNFLFSSEIRILTTFRKIITNIEKLAETDGILRNALIRAKEPKASEISVPVPQ